VKIKQSIKKIPRLSERTLQNEPSSAATLADRSTSRIRRFFLTKPTIISLVIIGCVVAIIVVRGIAEGDFSPEAKAPTYTTILPKEKSISELGGWKRISPPKKDPVFAFTDAVDGVPISVSEQPLPESFKNNTDSQVAELAQKFNATDKVDAGGIPVYIGTSSKGPQSVIFTKNNVLVLIKSEKKIQNTSWASYAQSLT
jgi:hypothetical protein